MNNKNNSELEINNTNVRVNAQIFYLRKLV